MKLKLIQSAVAVVALVAAPVSVQAADLPAAAPIYTKAPLAPMYNWTGFYLGGGGGYGMWNADTTALADPIAGPPFGGMALTQSITNGGRGWFGTATAGFDYQFNDRIVGGAFGDFDFASIKGTLNSGIATNVFVPLGGTETETSAWAVGARVGWLLTPEILTYWNAGYTSARFGGFRVDTLQGQGPLAVTNFSTQANIYHGFFLGSGVETQISLLGRGWFARTEYRYADYRSATLPVLTPAGAIAVVGGLPVDVALHPIVQTVRTELTYKFNWGR
jgi:outer membrane immunogenic protein